MGSHLIFVFLRAELSRDRNDSFLWKFCSRHGLEEEKVRDGGDRRVHAGRNAGRGYFVARANWRTQEDMAISCDNMVWMDGRW